MTRSIETAGSPRDRVPRANDMFGRDRRPREFAHERVQRPPGHGLVESLQRADLEPANQGRRRGDVRRNPAVDFRLEVARIDLRQTRFGSQDWHYRSVEPAFECRNQLRTHPIPGNGDVFIRRIADERNRVLVEVCAQIRTTTLE